MGHPSRTHRGSLCRALVMVTGRTANTGLDVVLALVCTCTGLYTIVLAKLWGHGMLATMNCTHYSGPRAEVF